MSDNTANKKREVPKQLQNEFFNLSDPFVEKMIAAHQRENLGWSRYSLKELAIQCVAIGYYHLADQAPALKAENEELKAANRELAEALEGVVNSWNKRMAGDVERLVASNIKGVNPYWSPIASLVDSEQIAKAKTALNNHKNIQ